MLRILSSIELGRPVVVGGAQESFPRADVVARRQTFLGTANRAVGRYSPFAHPALFVARRDYRTYGDDLCHISASVVAVGGCSQGFVSKGTVAREEMFHQEGHGGQGVK